MNKTLLQKHLDNAWASVFEKMFFPKTKIFFD